MLAFGKLFAAGIRQRKGTFIGIALLTLVVVAALVSSVSARQNVIAEYRDACAETGVADMQVWVLNPAVLADEDARKGFDDKLLGIEEVESAQVAPMLLTVPIDIDGTEVNRQIAWAADDPDSAQYRVFDDSATGFTGASPLEPGEAYLPISYRGGVESTVDLHVGSEIEIGSGNESVKVHVKGFVEEPLRGMSFTSPNTAFLAPADFAKLRDAAEDNLMAALSNPSDSALRDSYDSMIPYDVYNLSLSDGSNAAQDVMRAIGADDELSADAWVTLTADLMESAALVIVDAFMAVLIAFALILLLVTLLIVGNAVSSSIQLDYRTYGILKAQGMTNGALVGLVASQYAAAVLAGGLVGIAASFALAPALGSFFTPFTGLLGQGSLQVVPAVTVVLVVVVLVGAFALFKARGIAKVAPVRALNSGMPDASFSNPLTHDIRGRALNLSLAARSLTSAPGHYIGAVVMVGLLTTFLLLVVGLAQWARTGDLLSSMGYPSMDFDVTYTSEEQREQADDRIEEIAGIENSFRMMNVYLHVDGIQIGALVYDTPESYAGILEGRAPRYDDEILFTRSDEQTFGKTIGDTVEVRYNGHTEEFIICGIFQTANDMGASVGMLRSALDGMGDDAGTNYSLIQDSGDLTYNYELADRSKITEVARMLEDEFDGVEVRMIDELITPTPDQIAGLLTPVMIAIALLSLLVELIAAFMLTSRSYLRERTSLGIYRALGFSGGVLRAQFGLRFLLVAVIGALVGSIVALAFCDQALGTLFGIFGITSFDAPLGVGEALATAAFVVVSFGLFSYLAARKVGRVDTKSLITE